MSKHGVRRGMRAFRRVAPALAAAALSTAALATAAPAVAAESPVVVETFTAQQRADALAHWTPARMHAAALDKDAPATGDRAHESKSLLRTVGKVFFTNENTGADSYCTATSAGGARGDTVVTAAHCLTIPGTVYGQYGNVVFVPGYHDGTAPSGVFPARVGAYPRSFTTTEQNGYDIGVLRVDPVGGHSLRDTVGAVPVDLTGTTTADVTIFGYPMSKPRLGQRQLYCRESVRPSPVAGNLRSACNMTGGASGGPWLRGFDAATGAGTIISVTSNGVGRLDGAVFGARAKGVFDAAAAT